MRWTLFAEWWNDKRTGFLTEHVSGSFLLFLFDLDVVFLLCVLHGWRVYIYMCVCLSKWVNESERKKRGGSRRGKVYFKERASLPNAFCLLFATKSLNYSTFALTSRNGK